MPSLRVHGLDGIFSKEHFWNHEMLRSLFRHFLNVLGDQWIMQLLNMPYILSMFLMSSFWANLLTSILSFWSSVMTPEQTIWVKKVNDGSRSSRKQFKQFFKVAFSLGSISGSNIEAAEVSLPSCKQCFRKIVWNVFELQLFSSFVRFNNKSNMT